MTKVLSHKTKLIGQLGSIQHTNILDYGCGRGDFIELILMSNQKPKSIVAVDSSAEMISHIQQDFSQAITEHLVQTIVCSSPKALSGMKFDKILCHNVLECVDDKLSFINDFGGILADGGTLIISHHDFDSAIYNSAYKENTRALIHHFADAQQSWQTHCDGQMGRQIPGLIASSVFNTHATIETWRIVEKEFQPGNYGFLMAEMITDIAKTTHDATTLKSWISDLEEKNKHQNYYFAIDLVVAVLRQSK
ncbi:MAG: methyltransferase domain-containing protein [Legionella sp.]|nr:methyltransferase domain-containing protein [Legionella sp.]